MKLFKLFLPVFLLLVILALFFIDITILMAVSLIVFLVIIFIFIQKNKEYRESAYYQVTKLPFLSVRRNLGRYGEYLTYKYLKYMEANGAKFLFNVYIPKERDETTEIDVLMICTKGIFVFESKNYSGWIFGNENQKNWYQTLPAGRGRSHKEIFYNPIMQNHSHIKHLKALLGVQIPVYSIVVFSDRCTLKNVHIHSDDIRVINRYDVAAVISSICDKSSTDFLDGKSITDIYNKFYPFTQIDKEAKIQHIINIQNNLSRPTQISPIDQPSDTPVLVASEHTNAVSSNTVVLNKIAEPTITVSSPSIENIEQHSRQFKCPRCNGELIIRTATRGTNVGHQFYGCSNYPKCKYIQNIPDKTT